MPTKWDDNEEIQIFREYLQIPSVQPNIDYGGIFDRFTYNYFHKMIKN